MESDGNVGSRSSTSSLLLLFPYDLLFLPSFSSSSTATTTTTTTSSYRTQSIQHIVLARSSDVQLLLSATHSSSSPIARLASTFPSSSSSLVPDHPLLLLQPSHPSSIHPRTRRGRRTSTRSRTLQAHSSVRTRREDLGGRDRYRTRAGSSRERDRGGEEEGRGRFEDGYGGKFEDFRWGRKVRLVERTVLLSLCRRSFFDLLFSKSSSSNPSRSKTPSYHALIPHVSPRIHFSVSSSSNPLPLLPRPTRDRSSICVVSHHPSTLVLFLRKSTILPTHLQPNRLSPNNVRFFNLPWILTLNPTRNSLPLPHQPFRRHSLAHPRRSSLHHQGSFRALQLLRPTYDSRRRVGGDERRGVGEYRDPSSAGGGGRVR